MDFTYPPRLVAALKALWQEAQGPRRVRLISTWDSEGKMRRIPPEEQSERVEAGALDKVPFPNDKGLLNLLDTVYHASLLAEENRRLALRVAYLPPDVPADLRAAHLNMDADKQSFRLNPPRALTTAELMRLAPATDPTRTLVLVADSGTFHVDPPSPLVIWAVLHLGNEWWQLVTGRTTTATCPPNIFTVSSYGPGELVMSAGGRVLVRLRGGRVVTPPLGSLRDGPIGRFLSPAAEALYSEVCTKIGQTRYASDNSDDHPRNLYFQTLSNILLRTRERAHGGSFVIIRDELEPKDARLADRISLKYLLDGPRMWSLLLEEAVDKRAFYDLLFPEHSTEEQRVKRLANEPEALYYAHVRHETVEGNIADLESFIATLSGVDGAVVLTDRLRVIGFGGEITAGSPTLSAVRIAGDESGVAGDDRPITSFGTRHRSALRFCSSLEDAVAFVISQDGDMRGIKRVGRDLIMWSDLDLRDQVL